MDFEVKMLLRILVCRIFCIINMYIKDSDLLLKTYWIFKIFRIICIATLILFILVLVTYDESDDGNDGHCGYA